MLHFYLERPLEMLWFGDFVSPEHGWVHLTRRLFEYEMMIVTEGTLEISDGREAFSVAAGEYLIMSPTERQYGTKECRSRFYWMHFRCPALPATVSLPAHGKIPDGARTKKISEELLAAEMRDPRGPNSLYLSTLLLLSLCPAEPVSEKSALPREILTARVKDYVTYHRFSEIRVKEIAKELTYHEKYLSAVFRQTEGVPLKQYIDDRRTDEAKRLLAETDRPVSEIAYELGFQSPHNFARFFKKETGLTAGQYRASCKR